MRKRNVWFLGVLVVTFVFVFYYVNPIGYVDGLRAYDEALGQIARAESAQTPSEVMEHVVAAKRLLPESGSVSWWSGEKGDFKMIQAELDDIINRARNISSLQLGDELFNSEMYDIHSKLEKIQTLLAF